MFIGFYSVNGKIVHGAIYKTKETYGLLDQVQYPSIEIMIADLSRTGFLMGESVVVKLTNQLFPDK